MNNHIIHFCHSFAFWEKDDWTVFLLCSMSEISGRPLKPTSLLVVDGKFKEEPFAQKFQVNISIIPFCSLLVYSFLVCCKLFCRTPWCIIVICHYQLVWEILPCQVGLCLFIQLKPTMQTALNYSIKSFYNHLIKKLYNFLEDHPVHQQKFFWLSLLHQNTK